MQTEQAVKGVPEGSSDCLLLVSAVRNNRPKSAVKCTVMHNEFTVPSGTRMFDDVTHIYQ